MATAKDERSPIYRVANQGSTSAIESRPTAAGAALHFVDGKSLASFVKRQQQSQERGS